MPQFVQSEALARIAPSATMAAAAKAKALKASGADVLNFTLGEPDFDTPQHIRTAAKAAMDSGKTHYTPAGGLPEVKEAIVAAHARDTGVQYAAAECVISNGAKHTIHNVLAALLNPGDEVVIPTPYWVSYADLVALTGATPVLLPTTREDGWACSAEQLDGAITDATKLVMLNSPSNPTGAVYSREQLAALGEVIVNRDVWCLSDEIYSKLLYDGAEFTSFAALSDEVKARTITVNGVSKAYAMTGWRIGWMLGPEPIAKACTKLQSQETSNPCSVSQYAAKAAVENSQECVEEMRKTFAERRTMALEGVNALPGVPRCDPGGAFYAFFDVGSHFGKPLGTSGRTCETSDEFCEILLEDAHVALVSGDAFGAPGFVRMSYATETATIERGLERLRSFLGG
ncbi:pyridoxal phosphate-dependent aminotransferase [Alienimonas californiensis]|uniref:Aminotransferase n=1 Tax=Alienimonas californiensis TaxID=2527989 RepID=A0A517PCA5_9PLAN|nr:pyridoxal phosphate-dependent aminotransferase [Alienimonas californiensis]QDT17018.1 Aspartate aminotransferase [Alienimonas californiensis]